MDALHLIRTQLALERIGLDADGCLVRVPGPDPDEIARVAAYCQRGGYVTYFRTDVPCHVQRAIRGLGSQAAFCDQAAVTALPAEDGGRAAVEGYCTYIFPQPPSTPQFPDAIRLDESHWALIEACHRGMDVTNRAVFAVIRDGRIVSTCTSTREDDGAGEAYVFTLPACRRRGYGRQVTAAWGYHLLAEGKVAFYCHATHNVASQALAHSLGLQLAFELANYT